MKTLAEAIKHAKVSAKIFARPSVVYIDTKTGEYHAPVGEKAPPSNRFTKSWRRVARVNKDGSVIESAARVRNPKPKKARGLGRGRNQRNALVNAWTRQYSLPAGASAKEIQKASDGLVRAMQAYAEVGATSDDISSAMDEALAQRKINPTDKMQLLHASKAPAKKRARRKNPTVKGAYWLFLRSGRGWIKLGERPTVPLAKRAARQIADRTGMQVKIELARGRAG